MYNEQFPTKGHVYVFNVLKDRPGAKKDTENIEKTFRSLGYKVTSHEDFTKDEMLTEIKEIQNNRTLSTVGAVIIFILSHGSDRDTFADRNGEKVSLKTVKMQFTNKECPYLTDKPKIFFANFCRGQDIEADSDDWECKDHKVQGVVVDVAVVHASNEGVMALRSKDNGTVFVKSLCEILSSNYESKFFRHVYLTLSSKMKEKRGTTPMLEDHVFKAFEF